LADKWTLPPISSELNGTDFQVFLNKANDWYDDYRRKKPRPNLNDTVPKVPDILFGVETMIFQINWGAFSDKIRAGIPQVGGRCATADCPRTCLRQGA
jgi:hypothetical protein